MGTSAISWTDKTWVPLTGCTRVSPACDSCYAFSLHDQRHLAWKRGRLPAAPVQYHQPFSVVQLLETRLDEPLHWKKPSKVFLTSMGDVFHEAVPEAYLDRIFATVAAARQHTFQVLTKRPERMLDYFTGRQERLGAPPENLWLGATAEDQQRYDARGDSLTWLVDLPTIWLSCEPLLGPIDFGWQLQLFDWVVVGGESGPRYRELDLGALEQTVRQCKDAGVAVWVKQDSGRLPGKQGRIPDELWLHEFPEERAEA